MADASTSDDVSPARGYAPQEQTHPIVAMLVQEANAWHALLQLHGLSTAVARGLDHVATGDLRFDEALEASAQRDATYIASLTQLGAACDSMYSEIVKLRGLRRAKFQVDNTASNELMRAHANEILAIGESTARGNAVTISSVTAELRTASQKLKAQLSQSRALLQQVQEVRQLRLPANAVLVMGLQTGDEPPVVHPVEHILSMAYASTGQLTEDSLAAALSAASITPRTQASGRTFLRRQQTAPSQTNDTGQVPEDHEETPPEEGDAGAT